MGHHRGAEAINAATGVTTRQNGLRKTQPYWYEFQTYSKLRWFGRELIEIMTTEFRDRTKEYYVWAIHKGICTVNAKKADLHQILGDGDKICNSVHRHEPPVTDEPIKIIHRDDDEGILVIVKPGSIPVHAAGRYLRHTLVGLLQSEHGVDMVYTTNRLDRLTSGIMVCSTKKETASRLGAQFAAGQVNKAYVCRVRGKFPQGEVVCKQPILTIDRQSGVNIVHPKGKHCETIFVRLSYDASDDSSVVFCRPITGRTHQIRVHVQYLGHPICNDPIYGHDVWSKVDSSAFAEVIPDQWKKVGGEIGHKEVEKIVDAIKGDQDGQEDWARWKDEVLFKDMIAREGLENVHVPGPNGRSSRPSDELLKRALAKLELDTADVPTKGLNRPVDIETAWQKRVREQSSDFCPECKIPLLPDPKPEELYIYLHAIKYWTDEWSFEDALPWWAREDWQSITPHGSGTAQGAAEATLPEGLAIAHKSGTLLSSTAISSLITSEIEEKASRLAEPQKYAKHDQGVELTQVRQLVDYPVVDTGSSSRSSNNEQMAAAMEVVDIPVVFQVFGGFEDFAQREILQQTLLRASGDEGALKHKLGVSSSIHSGHVKVLDNKLAGHALQVYFDAKLGIAKTAYLLTAVREFPRELAKELKHEKHIGGASKRAKWKAKELRKALQKKEGKKLATQPTTPGIIQKPSILQKDGEKNESSRSMTAPSADGKATISTTAVEEATSSAVSEAETDEGAPFPSEVKLLELLDDIWEASRSQLDRALESWKCIVAATTGVPVATSYRTYRATVDRATYNLPSLNTQTMERYVGELAWDWLNGPDTPNTDLNAPTNWRVDLEKPMVDITLKFLPGFGIGDEFEKELGEQDDPALKTEGQIAFMIKLPPPATANPRRPAGRNALLVGGTAMAEYRAASLALALPLPTERKTLNGVQSGQEVAPLRVLEACCGHGSLVFETAAMMEARGLHGQVLGCDIDNETIERARCISNLAGFSSSSGAVSVQLGAIDGTDCSALQSFVGGSCSVDAIITDLPWGKREKASQSLSKLYHLFLESWFSVLRTGGYILTVTAEHRTLSRALSVFETTCRKKRLGACLRMEDMRMLDKNGSGLEQNKVKQQGVLEAQRNGQMRKIEIGYHVYVFMIRKIAI